jgi:hypothetical protein
LSLPAFIFLPHKVYNRTWRTTLSTSLTNASLTVEAAMTFPFYILVILSLASFINIIGLQSSIQMRLEETARQVNSVAYITLANSNVSSSSSNINALLFQTIFLSDDIKSLCDNSHIKNGSHGISFSNSAVDINNQTADIVITYTVNIPFIPNNLIQIPFSQHCRLKLFTGYMPNALDEPQNTTVYMTANGTVYHTNKYCTYLIKYTDTITKSSLASYQKRKKRKYSGCTACARNQYDFDSIIYLCETGYVYHYSKDCYYLTSHIFECSYKDVATRYPECSRCSKN